MLRVSLLLALVGLSALGGTAQIANSQTLYSDGDFLGSNYSVSGAGNQDVRFNIDYTSIDIFGDNFLRVQIPDAPRGGGTGVFISANNNSFVPSQQSFSSISPLLSLVNFGTGTAHPNYVMRVDVFHSTGTGIDNGSGTVTSTGTTNFSVVGINQKNTTVQMQSLNAAFGGLTGQGMRLAITADAGGAEDFVPIVGGALYRDRAGLTTVVGQTYDGDDGVDTGLATDTINEFWLAQNVGYVLGSGTPVTAMPTNDDLYPQTGNSLFYSPDPSNLAGYEEDRSGVHRSYWQEEFGKTSGPLHYTGGGVNPPAFFRPNGQVEGGVPYNRWATHELYWVDGVFTYVIDGIPVQQMKPDFDGIGGNDNIPNANNLSTSGTAVLGFWDAFGDTIALSPEGANFVIYDNLEIEVADSGDVPDMLAYLRSRGYLPEQVLPGDYNEDRIVDAADYVLWRNHVGAATGTLPNDTISSGRVIGKDQYDLWRSQFGATGESGFGTGAVVPEPMTLSLLLTIFVGLFLHRLICCKSILPERCY